MAHALRVDLVAEGVESEWDAQFLSAAGFDHAQGFHYTRALPADKCLSWIVEFNGMAMLTAGRAEPGQSDGIDQTGNWPRPDGDQGDLMRGTQAKPA